MPQQVIDQVHRLARRANGRRTLEFQHDVGVVVGDLMDDIDDDDTYEPGGEDHEDSSYGDDGSDDSDDDDNSENSSSGSSDNDESDSDSDEGDADDVAPQDDETNHDDGVEHVEEIINDHHDDTDEIQSDDDMGENAGVDDDHNVDELGEGIPGVTDDDLDNMEADEDTVADMARVTLNGKELRPKACVDYMLLHHGSTLVVVSVDLNTDGTIHLDFHEAIPKEGEDGLMFVTPQMNFKQGLKAFGDKGELAVGSELKQVHDMKGVRPCHKSELPDLDRARALRYLMYLKEKRNGVIKARGFADGQKQRLWTNKEDASSPTISLGALILSCVINAYEGQHVVTLDVPGVFLQTSMDGEETVHILLEGKMAELMCKVDPATYSQYLFQENGKTYMYVELTRALYGTLKAALLFWIDLSSELVKMGFTINPYDWCVTNKTINDTQCTVVWHIDDLKISHKDPKVVQDVVTNLDQHYGQVSPLTTQHGSTHEYLGMDITYPGDSSVHIGMIPYIDGVLEEAPESMKSMDGDAETPASDHLFRVMTNQTALNKDEADFFHHMTAKLLFLCKRARPDIQTAVAFLCSRVEGPDVDDMKKLR